MAGAALPRERQARGRAALMTAQEQALARWLRQARETVDEAHVLAHAGHLRGYVNRLYYACFYAATAPLLSRGLGSTKHAGVRALLHQHFVRNGEAPKDLARTYDRMFDRRQAGDYEVLTEPQQDDPSARIRWTWRRAAADNWRAAVADRPPRTDSHRKTWLRPLCLKSRGVTFGTARGGTSGRSRRR